MYGYNYDFKSSTTIKNIQLIKTEKNKTEKNKNEKNINIKNIYI